ncbi:MAG: phenylalanine--tRNA ligase subunit beta, partial [Pseudohongiellaceae bacterium]
PAPLTSRSEQVLPLARLKRQMVSLGFQETVTYSFIEPGLARAVAGEAELIRLQNPISEDMSVMRTSILPGLLSVLQYNQNRRQDRLRLFEAGMVFQKQGGETHQEVMLAGLISGQRLPINWSNNKDSYDFYDVKGDVESLLFQGGKTGQFSFRSAQIPVCHPGRCSAVIADDGSVVGHLGALHPQLQRDLDLHGEIYLFELRLAPLQHTELPRAKSLSRHPEVSRDLAIVVDESVAAGDLLAVVRENAGENLADLRIFDVYQGDAVTKNKKSLALGLTWQHPSRTLSDEEINAIISSCINALEEQFNASLRD